MNERIVKIRQVLGINQTKFAEKLGLTSATISSIEHGKSKLTEQTINLICLTFRVREEWLREGKGDMMDEEAMLSEQEHQLLEFFRELTPLAREMLVEYAQKLVSDEKALREGVVPSQNAPGGMTRPLEAPQEAKRQEGTDDGKGANPIHDKRRG